MRWKQKSLVDEEGARSSYEEFAKETNASIEEKSNGIVNRSDAHVDIPNGMTTDLGMWVST